MRQFLAMILVLLAPLSLAKDSQKRMELKPSGKPSSYVQQMIESNHSPEPGVQLQSYLNSLLKANAIVERNPSKGGKALLYSVRANKGGELVITRVEKDSKGRLLENRSLLVFGVGSLLESGCSRHEQRCWVLYPDRDERWLEIDYAPTAVQELAKGMGLLIREMQR
ncbi:MAG: hypothetical protein ACR2PT_20480 [Endozoicomonas sp.]